MLSTFLHPWRSYCCLCCCSLFAREVFGDDNLVIISIGTGRTAPMDFTTAKDMKREEWVKPVLDILKEGVQDSISAQLETLARSKGKPVIVTVGVGALFGGSVNGVSCMATKKGLWSWCLL